MNQPASKWWNPFTVEQVCLTTALTDDDCIQRIRAKLYSFWRGADPSLPFGGVVRRNRFTIFRNTPHFRNAFRPIAYGVVRSDASNGTTITIQLSLPLPARIWWLLLFAFLTMIFLLSVLGSTGTIKVGSSLFDPLNVLIGEIVAGGIFYFSYLVAFWFSRRERTFLIDTFQAILFASVMDPQNNHRL